MAQTNTKRTAAHRTHEGAPARRDNLMTRLEQVLNAHMLWEDQFYIDGEAGNDLLTRAVKDAALLAPYKAGLAIMRARGEHNIRHASLKAAVVYAQCGAPDARDLITNVISRVDEIAEVIAMAGGKKAPHAVMKGARDAFGFFDEYQFAKYKGAGKSVSLRDAVFLTHPNPEKYPLVQKIVDETLDVPNTWETRLSGGEDKAEVFTDLLIGNRLGAMALLRNLRGMDEAGVERHLVREALDRATWRRVLPFRFMSALQQAPQFAPELDKAFIKAVAGSPRLPGRTAVMLDTSGSMQSPISQKSTVMRHHAGAALAAAVNGDEVDLFQWASTTKEVPNFRSLSTAMGIHAGAVGHGTDFTQAWHYVKSRGSYDRFIVLSDMQFADGKYGYGHIDTPPAPAAKCYTIDLAAYQKPGIIPGQWTHLSGWSANVLKWMAAAEGL